VHQGQRDPEIITKIKEEGLERKKGLAGFLCRGDESLSLKANWSAIAIRKSSGLTKKSGLRDKKKRQKEGFVEERRKKEKKSQKRGDGTATRRESAR